MVEKRTRTFKSESYDELFINGVPVEMGEGIAELITIDCKIHGKVLALHGYNQGGYDGMSVCLQCCFEIAKQLLSK